MGLEQLEKLKDWLLEEEHSGEATQLDADRLRRVEPTGPDFRIQIKPSSCFQFYTYIYTPN